MRIAFDLDDTLICYQPSVPCEAAVPLRVLRWWFDEPLRAGTTGLMKELVRQGCEIWIYTSSFRNPRYLKNWFRLLGIRLGGVVNGDIHVETLLQLPRDCVPRVCSKYPPAFGIDLLVDNCEGVKMEGDEHGFEVVHVHPHDLDWTAKVLAAVDAKRAAKATEA